jgi:hypothetical protein
MSKKRAVQVSASELQRDFFKAFFAALCLRGESWLEWGAPSTDVAFRRVAEFLAQRAGRSGNVAMLAALMRPDPVSGIVTAVSNCIMYLQPGIVSIPNPSYKRIKLVATRGLGRMLREDLPRDVDELLDDTVDAFLNQKTAGAHGGKRTTAGPGQAR